MAVVTDALDDGLEAEALNEIAARMRARIGEDLSAGKSETAAREMAQEKVRELKAEQSKAGSSADGSQPTTVPVVPGGPVSPDAPVSPGAPATTPGKSN
jgi:cell pole-organizing protein PopZ